MLRPRQVPVRRGRSPPHRSVSISRAALVPACAVASRPRRTPDRYSCSESTVRRQAVNAAASACGFCEDEGGSAREDPARALSTPRALGERARQRMVQPGTGDQLSARRTHALASQASRCLDAAASACGSRRALGPRQRSSWPRRTHRSTRLTGRTSSGRASGIEPPFQILLTASSAIHLSVTNSRCRQWRAFPEARCPRLRRRRALNGSPDIDASVRAALPGRRRSSGRSVDQAKSYRLISPRWK